MQQSLNQTFRLINTITFCALITYFLIKPTIVNAATPLTEAEMRQASIEKNLNRMLANFRGILSKVRYSPTIIQEIETTNSATPGKYYWNTHTQKYKIGLIDGSLSDLPSSNTILTSSEMITKNTNLTATPGVNYWNKETKEFQMGQLDGSLGNMPDTSNTFIDAQQIIVLNTSQTAKPGTLYWDNENRKYYIGNADGTLRVFLEE